MDLNNTTKKYVKIDRETASDEIFALLDEVNSELGDDTKNLMNDLDTESVLVESLKNELDSDDKPLTFLVPEANYTLFENLTIGKNVKRR